MYFDFYFFFQNEMSCVLILYVVFFSPNAHEWLSMGDVQAPITFTGHLVNAISEVYGV